jgi:phenylacetate-CoA ligase
MIWNVEFETMSQEDIRQLQVERLQSTLNRVYKNVPYYKSLFDEHRIIPEEINSIKDLQQIPFTTKATLRDNYPYGMFAVPLREVVRIHSSSGTTGKPTVVGYTRNDLKHWSELMARVLAAAGVTKDDTVQIAFDYGLFTGGFGFHYGAELIGASVVPTSLAAPEKQIHIMRDYRTSVLACSPSFALAIAEKLKELKVNPNELVMRIGIFGSEPWSEKLRSRIQNDLFIDAYDTYGLSEIMGPGVASECDQKNGLHLFEDHYIAEIIDPDTGRVLAPGEIGELVLTTITKEAMPMIRYRTGDVTTMIENPCSCGRKSLRLARFTTRSDDMFVIHGVKLFPSQIESILANVEHTEPHYQIIIEREGGMDELEIQVEVSEKIVFDEVKTLMKIQEEIKQRILEEYGIHVKVKLVEAKSLARSQGKIKRVIDRRNQQY